MPMFSSCEGFTALTLKPFITQCIRCCLQLAKGPYRFSAMTDGAIRILDTSAPAQQVCNGNLVGVAQLDFDFKFWVCQK